MLSPDWSWNFFSTLIKECIEIIKSQGLNYQLGANGTAIEGDWDKVFDMLKSAVQKFIQKELLEFTQR